MLEHVHDAIPPRHADRATPARQIRSASAPLLSAPRVRTEFARRAFSVAGPTVYNSLPANIRLCHSRKTDSSAI